MKAVQLLGQPVPDVSHIPYGQTLPNGTTKHVFIKRDPRNTLISWMRYNWMSVTEGTIMAAIGIPTPDGTLLQVADSYLGWLTDPSTYVVKFEDLISNEATLEGVATFLGVPYIAGSFANLPGYTTTWTGTGTTPAYSDYTQVWTSNLASFWTANGGDTLVSAYGY
ncbi:MAG: sulfotransferase domain-containing protein [Burkholderiaceae bacterium]|nr:sulfotransferase domain-containing protein [Burkholderiaceae bacterium]